MLTALKSKWMNGGAPVHCARCHEAFDQEAYRSEATGRYYCSAQCRQWAEDDTIEQIARKYQ